MPATKYIRKEMKGRMNQYHRVRLTMEERIATIIMDHPPVNALDAQTISDLEEAFEEALHNADIKVIIITGAGQLAFVAGADIRELDKLETPEPAKAFALKGQTLFNKIEASRKPVIAAINGACLGGGNELAMACHIRIAGENARFGQPEINLGIMPGWGGTQRLPRLVGRGKALEWLLTGDIIHAQEAYRIGLVSQVVPPERLMETAQALARKIASRSAIAIAAILDAVEKGLAGSLRQGLLYEADRFAGLVETEDMHEGVRAFLEKRTPIFRDR